MIAGPVIACSEREPFGTIPAENTLRSSKFSHLPTHMLSHKLIIPQGTTTGQEVTGVPDDNRAAIFPDIVVEAGDKFFALSVKGVGARSPMYGDWIQATPFWMRRSAALSGNTKIGTQTRCITSESWYGEEPWGAVGETCARSALSFTDLVTDGCTINGFFICPVLEVNVFPQVFQETAQVNESYWYRRYSGFFYQEQRLVPSNVRLFHQSENTLGSSPTSLLRLFGIENVEDLDGFIDRYIASGLAALTLFVRTLRPCKWGVEGLDYGDTWLDKDCIIAPDGTLFFADLEDLDWMVGGQDRQLADRVHHQFGRNFYEFMYGLDCLLRERECVAGTPHTQEERRHEFATRVELALTQDQYVRCERSTSALDIIIQPHVGGFDSIPERVVDLR